MLSAAIKAIESRDMSPTVMRYSPQLLRQIQPVYIYKINEVLMEDYRGLNLGRHAGSAKLKDRDRFEGFRTTSIDYLNRILAPHMTARLRTYAAPRVLSGLTSGAESGKKEEQDQWMRRVDEHSSSAKPSPPWYVAAKKV